jgi:hypothetical protein
MSTRIRRVTAPRLALSKPEAAAALGMSLNSFERHVQPELRVIRRGQLRLFPMRELERWLENNADLTIDLADASGH